MFELKLVLAELGIAALLSLGGSALVLICKGVTTWVTDKL